MLDLPQLLIGIEAEPLPAPPNGAWGDKAIWWRSRSFGAPSEFLFLDLSTSCQPPLILGARVVVVSLPRAHPSLDLCVSADSHLVGVERGPPDVLYQLLRILACFVPKNGQLAREACMRPPCGGDLAVQLDARVQVQPGGRNRFRMGVAASCLVTRPPLSLHPTIITFFLATASP